jgi:hypothetical protein
VVCLLWSCRCAGCVAASRFFSLSPLGRGLGLGRCSPSVFIFSRHPGEPHKRGESRDPDPRCLVLAISRPGRLRGGRFDLLPKAESLFFACPKKSNPKKGHPRLALAGEAGQFVRGGRAFRRGSCPGEKESASLPIPLRAFSSTPHRRTGGPVDQELPADGSCRFAAHRIAAGRVAPASVHKAKRQSRGRQTSPLGGEFSTAVGKRSVSFPLPQWWESVALPLPRLGGRKA